MFADNEGKVQIHIAASGDAARKQHELGLPLQTQEISGDQNMHARPALEHRLGQAHSI